MLLSGLLTCNEEKKSEGEISFSCCVHSQHGHTANVHVMIKEALSRNCFWPYPKGERQKKVTHQRDKNGKSSEA